MSLTDRCNLRCTYCMPAEGLDWLPAEELLTDAEILRLVEVGVQRLGITNVRLTGGEPLLRKNLEALVAGIAELRPRPSIALTTNGIGLAARATRLAEAGLDRINISLDTLDPDTFASLTRRRRLPDVLAGVPRPGRPVCVRSRSTRCCCAGSTTTRRPICCLGDGRGGAAAVHRADAAGRPARLAAHGDGHRRRDPGPAARTVRAGGGRAGRPAAGQRPGRAVPGGGHRLRGRHHRLGDASRSAGPATGSG